MKNHYLALVLLPLVGFVSCETTEIATKSNHISSYQKLEIQTDPLSGGALIRKADQRELQKYTKVMVDKVKVYPSRVSKPGEKAATKEEAQMLAAKFETILKKELSTHYQLTNRPGSDTLKVRAALTELRPSNPMLFALNYAPYVGVLATGYQVLSKETLGSGSTSVEAEVVGSSSNRQVYALMDRMKGSKFQPSGLEKWGQSEQAMRIWSRKIRLGIDKTAAQ
jgi:hypothetical protein